MVGAALVFLGLRWYVRATRTQQPMLSDLFVSLAWIAFVFCCACDTKLYQLGFLAKKRTYEQKLTTIGSNPALTVETLKVLHDARLVNDR